VKCYEYFSFDITKSCSENAGQQAWSYEGFAFDATPTILEVTHGDGSALLETYSIRAEIAAEKGRASESYADLVTSIKNRRPKNITVLHVGTDEVAFLVFTDADDKQILGVIPGHTTQRPAGH
jgi:hypothetical protein